MVDVPELRTDPLTGDRVVVAPARSRRPGAWPTVQEPPGGASSEVCPFCEGHETQTPPEIFAISTTSRETDTPGWRVRVVPNKFPAFGAQETLPDDGIFVAEAATGTQDVLIHTPRHVTTLTELEPEALDAIASAWRWRGGAGLAPGTGYVHAVVNEGREAGASLEHSHSQLFSLAFVPPRLARELERQAGASGCLACELIAAEIDRGARVIQLEEPLVSYCPHASRFPYETVVAPLACEPDAFSSDLLGRALHRARSHIGTLQAEIGRVPVNVWLTTSPRVGGRTHWRLTVAPRLTRAAGLELGAELSINPVSPEHAAALLRRA